MDRPSPILCFRRACRAHTHAISLGMGWRLGLGLGLASLAGCAAAPPDFNSPEPAARNAAIVRAAKDKNQAAIPDLVRMLDSDDPATRVLAIRTLERLTGTTRGYDPESSDEARAKAVADWTAWCKENPTN